jgi:hypothetical protein
MAVKFGHLNNAIKTGFKLQKLNIYGEQQGTLFLTTKKVTILELYVTTLEEKLCTYRHNLFQHIH